MRRFWWAACLLLAAGCSPRRPPQMNVHLVNGSGKTLSRVDVASSGGGYGFVTMAAGREDLHTITALHPCSLILRYKLDSGAEAKSKFALGDRCPKQVAVIIGADGSAQWHTERP